MKNSRLFKRLKKSGGARALALIAAILLASEPFAFALSQVVNKYPTGTPAIGSVDMGGGNILYYGDVFGFNSAKNTTAVYGGSEAVAPPDVYAEIREGACRPEVTSYNFGTGTQGWLGTTAATGLSYMYDGVIGSGSLKALFARKSTSTAAFTYEKAFFYDCGSPATATFSMAYTRDIWLNPGATNNFTVTLVRPDLTTKVLVNAQNITATSLAAPTYAVPAIAATDFTQVGTYKLRITGTLTTLNTGGSKVAVAFDDINLTISPTDAITSYQQDVQFASTATPFSSLGGAGNGYRLEIRARKVVDDAEATYIKVLTPPSTWNTRYTIPGDTLLDGQENAWSPYDTYYLTDAEYNNGSVSVKYVDAIASGDSSQGGVDVEFQRIRVDQGACVDSVRDNEADCGKCHNYNSDVTKPWPTVGMHNKHAQTESASDCLWCHPNNGSDSAHRNGIQGGYDVELGGTKVYRSGQTPTAAGIYDSATKRCSSVDCHKGIQTPRWDATYPPTGPYDGISTIARNCSRCHNSGTQGADTFGEYNLAVAWPNDAGGGHTSHNSAFTINELSCQTNGSCHPDNRGQHSKVGDGVIEVKMQSSYSSPGKTAKYLTATKTCANVACHGGQQTPAFNLANTPPGIGPIDVATQCTKCHAPEKADGWLSGTVKALQYNAPLSGLHRGAPPISGKNHIDYACTQCHNSPTKHFREGAAGTNTNLHTKDMDAVVTADIKAATIGYVAGTGTSPNFTTPPTCATPTVAACHAESLTANRNPATSWKRRWSWDSYAAETPDTEKVKQCNGCHGHWTTFVDGVVQPHVTSNSDAPLLAALSSNHSDSGIINCATMCHAQTDPLYNHGVSMTATSKDMTLNTNAGIVRTAGPPARVGCSFCHAANDGSIPDGGGPATNHVFAESNWVTDTAATGPTPTCANDTAGCHGNVAGTKYWPDGSTYPDKAGKHDMHMTKLAAKLGYTLPGSDAEQKIMCQYCHNTLSPGLAGHTSDATANQAEVSSFKRIQDGAADTVTAGTFATADGSCSNVDCHNNKATSTTFGWRSAGTSTCTMCHTRATTGNNPSSGLHYGSTAPTVSGKWHDDTLSTGCTVCHATIPAPATSTHINGTFTGLSTSDANLTIMGLPITAGNRYTATADNVGSCSGAWVGGTSCHGDAIKGVGDQGTWARKWDSSLHYVATGNECKGCHGGFAGTDWTLGLVANTTDGSVEHGRNWDTPQDGVAEVSGNHKDNLANGSRCNMCHVYADAGYTYATNHRNGSIEMNSTTGYQTATWNCTSVCHVDNTLHNLEDSGWPVALVAGPALTCISCHTGSGSGAFKVGSASSHTDPDGAGATYTAGNNCAVCHHSSHAAETTNTIAVTWDTRTMGTSYVTGDGKIHLKKLSGTETSEAEICWNCHWGTNMPTISPLIKEFGSTQGAYTTGTLNQRNWYGATWTSANFAYKNGAIASVHQALSSTSVDPVKDTTLLATEVTTLGCVSCHDVHKVGNNGFTPTGQPYLRGSWTSNPFKEDGAPGGGGVSTWAASKRDSTGSVPRAAAMLAIANNELGGWQIEQNNAAFANTDYGTNPTTSFAGLCSKCHTKTGLEAIGWTGHKAAVSGFTGTGGTNVFSSTVRGGTGLWTNGHMGHQGSNARSSSYVGGLRNGIQYNDGIAPADADGKPATGGVTIGYLYGTVKTITMDGTTVQADFHNFPCSKCHSPHASRLPRLMITNCLDVKHNTWDNTQGNPSTWAAAGQTHVAKQLAYASSAGNCHRYVLGTDANREAAAENGWNSVTPW